MTKGAHVALELSGRTISGWHEQSFPALAPASARGGGHPDPAALDWIARSLVVYLAALP